MGSCCLHRTQSCPVAQAAKLRWQSPGHAVCRPNTENNPKVVQNVGLAGAVPYLQTPQLWVSLAPLVFLSPREWCKPLRYPSLCLLSCHQKECLDFMLNILDASRTSKPQQGAWEHLRENIRGICFYKGKETNKASVWGWFFHPRLYIQIITLDMGFFIIITLPDINLSFSL